MPAHRPIIVALMTIVAICAEASAQDLLQQVNPYGEAARRSFDRSAGSPNAAAASRPFSSGSPVQMLGIEVEPPAAQTASSPATSPSLPPWNDPATGAYRTQYPLDDDAYSGPPDRSSQAHSNFGTSRPPTAASPSAATGWFELDNVDVEGSWLFGGRDRDSLGVTTIEARAKFKFSPFPLIAIAPRAASHWLDGPATIDAPARLYDTSVEAVLFLPLREDLFFQAALSPGLFTDGHNTNGDAFRLPGRALAFWKCSPTLTLAGGFVYLDRDDVSFLPAIGLTYKPNDDFKLELIMPRPKVAWRMQRDGTTDHWLYLVGEFGGGSWAVERDNGRNDVLTLSDYRAIIGWEMLNENGPDLRLEGGYVFNRTLEYTAGREERDLAGTALVRFAFNY
ncbi:MAG: DUF6268 family outer membrane beta-barrel protein [Planctomycetaceae bacterium]